MKIKKYLVKTLNEVDELMRRDLGDQAVILSIQKVRSKGFSSLFSSDQLEVVAALADPESSTQSSLGENISTYLDPRFNRKQQAEVGSELYIPNVRKVAGAIQSTFIEKETARLRDLSASLVENFQSRSLSSENKSINTENPLLYENTTYKRLLSCLLSKGLDREFVETLLKECRTRYGENFFSKKIEDPNFFETLCGELACKISVTGPLLLAQKHPTHMGMMGPSGIGKTSALLKIAHQYSKEANKKVAFIRVERQIGQHTPCRFESSYAIIQTKEEWNQAFLEFKDHDLVLFDLPNFSRSEEQLFKAWIDEWNIVSSLDIYLALNVGIKIEDARYWIDFFRSLSPKALVATKLDETSTLGELLTLSSLAKLPLSYLTSGPETYSNLQIANPQDIAKRILSTLHHVDP